jgi:putative transposase
VQALKRRRMPAPSAFGPLCVTSTLKQRNSTGGGYTKYILDKRPERLQPRAKSRLHEIMRAEGRDTALGKLARFQEEYEAKYPIAVSCLTTDTDTLFTVMDYPAAYWLHLRTTNAIESAFAMVKAHSKN